MRKFRSVATLFILALFSLSISYTEEMTFNFRHITVEDGLSQSSVMEIIQDRHGFMWFGTQEGLNRFDGYRFKIYKHDPDNSNSLSGNRVWGMCEDHMGYLWVATNNSGLNRFDPEREEFTRYVNDPQDPASLSDNRLYCVIEDHEGVIWVGSDGGVNRFNRENGTFSQFKHDPENDRSISNDYINYIFEDSRHDLWISTDGGGLNLFDRKSEEFTRFKHDPQNSRSISSDYVWEIMEDHKGILWIGTHRGINLYDRKSQRFTRYYKQMNNPYSLSDNESPRVFEDSMRNIWIGTNTAGLCQIAANDRDAMRVTRIPGKNIFKNGFSDNMATALYEDRSGVLWVGTWDNGINQLDLTRKKFYGWTNHSGKTSLGSRSVNSVCEDHEGKIWIASHNKRLDCFDPKTNRMIWYEEKPDDPGSLRSNRIWEIYEDSENDLWVGTEKGLHLFHRDRNKFIVFQNDPDDQTSISNNTVYGIKEGKKGELWVGTYDGLNRLIKKRKSFTRYTHDPNDPTSLCDNMVHVVYRDRKGVIWVGTNNGLGKFNDSDETFVCYRNIPINRFSINGNRVQAIFESTGGVLWIGTTKGLNRFDPAEEKFYHLSERDGLANSVIYDILEDDSGCLWMSTNHGLSKYDPAKNTFTNFDTSDGLLSNKFNPTSAFRTRDGMMYFGCNRGITRFYPEQIHINDIPPELIFTDFQIFNKSLAVGERIDGRTILERAIFLTESIELSYRDNGLGFEFAALHYTDPRNNQYGYFMEGFDREWNMVNNRRFANYGNLPPGEYVFRVKGANSDGVWNNKSLSVKINVIPPFWQTLWFKIFMGIAVFSIFFAWYLVRIRNIESQKDYLEKVVRQRTAEISRQNAEIQAQAEKLARTNKEMETLSIVASETENAITIMDAEGNIEWINEGYARMYELSLDEVMAEKGKNLVDSSINPDIRDVLETCIKRHDPVSYETVCETPSGKAKWAKTTLTPIMDIHGKLSKIVAIDTDISDLKRANNLLEQLATEDGLTGISNHRYFMEFFEREWRRCIREKHPISVLIASVDHFKLYNDAYGHRAGDERLRRIANVLDETIKRPGDLVARYGEAEFAFVLSNTHQTGALHVAQLLKHAVQELKISHEHSAVSKYVTISLGVATVSPERGMNPSILVEAADKSMYQSKKKGRNHITVHDGALD